jgi:S-DNA-T family DNA segregation ATPase FtsK/SpoIIIE
MTVERLRAVLSRIGPPGPGEPPVTPREIAEILWLAAHIAEERPAPAAERTGPEEHPEEPPAAEVAPAAPPGPSGPSGTDPVPVPTAGRPARRELHAPPATSAEGTRATKVLVPTAPMLDHPLAVQRALRPLKRRVPSRRARLLDEQATAARIADRPLHLRPWVPVMAAAPERWLSLVLVVDDGPSMRLWRPLARELHETFLRLGAFRDLRLCRLVATGSGVGVVASPSAPPRGPATLVDPSGRQVVLVLSDCSGPHWWDGSAGRALHLWARAGPAAILQPLTERLWRRTAAPTVPGSVVAARVCAPSTALRFTPYEGETGMRPGALPVPVLECSPGWLGDWATLVAGGGARSAAMTYVSDRPAHGAEPVRQEHRLPIRERVQRFQSTASPEAVSLAAHVAVSFPALPVMRLIQQRILHTSRPGHLAEVLLSGLLRPVEGVPGRYDFVAGVREALLRTLPRSESWHTADVLTRISEEIERRAGGVAETFTAYLPAEDGDHALGPDGRPFALVSGEALRLLGRSKRPAAIPQPRTLAEQLDLLDQGPETAILTAPERYEPPDELPSARRRGGGFLGLVGVSDPEELDVSRLWAPRSERDFLRVPFGEDLDGRPVFLDLKESAQGGMGPHGLCIGATGTGKSELLRTLVLATAISHPPDQVGMVLVDYKGGATFAPFEGLPHVAGMISNLEHDPGLAERAHASLAGEVRRRQDLLRNGGFRDIHAYRARRASGRDLEPLPHLLVVVDEFAELIAARPEFVDLFMTIGRVGRAVGIHLLLVSQRLAGVELHGLERYLSYRLGLRTFSEPQSQAILGNADAYHLPSAPGSGYLQIGTAVYQRFNIAFVSSLADEAQPSDGRRHFAGEWMSPLLLEVMARQLVRRGEPYRRLWLPPLPAVTTLDAICGPAEATDEGLRLGGGEGNMRVPLGVLDDPARHRQDVWTLDLTAKGGHVAVIGSPQSGKTTLLRALVLSLALTHTPRQVAVYAVDLVSGTGMRPLRKLPHVVAVAGAVDPEAVRRTVRRVREALDDRHAVFRGRGIDSLERLRELHAAGQVPELPTADVVFVIDGIGMVRRKFEVLESEVADLLQRGGAFGVHVVASVLRWDQVRPTLQPNFGTKLELHLNDPLDSAIARTQAEIIRIDQPGRVLTDRLLFAQAALPRIDGVLSATELTEAIEQTGSAARAAWSGAQVPPVTVRENPLDAADLPSAADEPARVPIGRDVATLSTVYLDLFGLDEDLLVLGDHGCGKTNLLRLIARGLVERFPPESVSFVLMDPRGGLRGAVPDAYLHGYADSAAACASLADRLAETFQAMGPGAREADEPRVEQTGSLLVVLVDDYETLTAEDSAPLERFLDYAWWRREVGLHFVVARQVTGAARGLYEPFLMALRAATGLVMNGDRDEGRLLDPGVYASAQPPGRGQWVRHGAPVRTIQTALVEGSSPAVEPMPVTPALDVDARTPRLVLAVEIQYRSAWLASERLRAQYDLQQVLNLCERALHGRNRWYRERTGDGELVVLPVDTDAVWLVDRLPRTVASVLASYNADRPASHRLLLRLALDHGLVASSGHSPGLAGHAVIVVTRLVDAFPEGFFGGSPRRDMGLIMSVSLQEKVDRADPQVLRRNHFERLRIRAKGEVDAGYLYEGGAADVR